MLNSFLLPIVSSKLASGLMNMKTNTKCGCSSCSSEIKQTTSTTGTAELKDHILARVGFRRQNHKVTSGLYSLGQPNPDSPVFVTSNYTLSFDALRSSLKNINCYVLVLDTQGINVWCAAGKGTFGTDELVKKIAQTNLSDVVSHRKLILPQLGASGVDSFEVEKQSGFKVEYGPVRASDIQEYLKNGATTEMRQVKYTLKDRLVLVPVEISAILLPLILAVVALYFVGGVYPALAAASAILAGTALFPMLLPWLPTKDFSSKGFILGVLAALPFAVAVYLGAAESALWLKLASALAYVFLMAPVTAYLSLNFTGSTTFTSRSGVKREIFRYIPVMAGSLVLGVALAIMLIAVRLMGGAF